MIQKLLKYLLFPVYLLQLENYDLTRFVKGSIRHIYRRPLVWRSNITWTYKLKLITAIAILPLVVLVGVIATVHWFLGLLSLALFVFAFSVFLYIAVWFVKPLETPVKGNIVKQAKDKISKMEKLKVVGIAGSYGKTTMKEAVSLVLSQQYKVLSTPENINTSLGIAQLILERLTPETEIFVVEMGEFVPGDVKEICDMVRPHLGIVTGINEAHLERMGNLDAAIGTIFELVEYSRPDALIVLNGEDEHVVLYYPQFIGDHKHAFYNSKNSEFIDYNVSNYVFDDKEVTQNFTIELKGFSGEPSKPEPQAKKEPEEPAYTFGTPISELPKEAIKEMPKETVESHGKMSIKTKLLGEYFIGVSMAAAIVGKYFQITLPKVSLGLSKLSPIPHRLEPIINPNGVIVIDDSYNGNPEGVRQAISLLAKFKDRRKIYLTPGLVEMGSSTEQIHQELGKQLAGIADLVLLIDTDVAKLIISGLNSGGFSAQDIQVFPTTQEAHKALQNILKPGDVILFQNDWPDNYT